MKRVLIMYPKLWIIVILIGLLSSCKSSYQQTEKMYYYESVTLKNIELHKDIQKRNYKLLNDAKLDYFSYDGHKLTPGNDVVLVYELFKDSSSMAPKPNGMKVSIIIYSGLSSSEKSFSIESGEALAFVSTAMPHSKSRDLFGYAESGSILLKKVDDSNVHVDIDIKWRVVDRFLADKSLEEPIYTFHKKGEIQKVVLGENTIKIPEFHSTTDTTM